MTTLNEQLLEESNRIRISKGLKRESAAQLKKRARAQTEAVVKAHYGNLTEVSILPLPDPKPLILIEKNDQFDIIGQDVEVNIEKNMIKDQTNISASILNKVTKIKNSIKEIFHKKAPTRITVTKPSELENRTIAAPGGIGIIIIIVVIYLLIRGK